MSSSSRQLLLAMVIALGLIKITWAEGIYVVPSHKKASVIEQVSGEKYP